MIIVALFMIGPAHRDKLDPNLDNVGLTRDPLEGTGGTDMVRFLRGVRDQTGEMLIDSS